jgi:hypothetical protein
MVQSGFYRKDSELWHDIDILNSGDTILISFLFIKAFVKMGDCLYFSCYSLYSNQLLPSLNFNWYIKFDSTNNTT